MYKVEDLQLEKNFMLHELVCKCGKCENKIDIESVRLLQQLRNNFGKPVQVVSGYRCETYNKKIGGAVKSQHLFGKAFDIKVKGFTPREVAIMAERVGFKGIGIYPTFTHVDTRFVKSYWVQDSKGNVTSVSKI